MKNLKKKRKYFRRACTKCLTSTVNGMDTMLTTIKCTPTPKILTPHLILLRVEIKYVNLIAINVYKIQPSAVYCYTIL